VLKFTYSNLEIGVKERERDRGGKEMEKGAPPNKNLPLHHC